MFQVVAKISKIFNLNGAKKIIMQFHIQNTIDSSYNLSMSQLSKLFNEKCT